MNLPEEFEITLREMYPNGIDWDLVGVLTRQSKVYTLTYDSKILSSIFEILCEPIISHIAEKYGLTVEKGTQTVYPEFTLFNEESQDSKIAIDVKSTYRKPYKNGEGIRPFSFTLGSYTSYLRDPREKKNILHPYSQYSHHWIIGFLYDRNPNSTRIDIKEIIEAARLEAPYSNIEYFVQEKFRIAGLKPGSGNTKNIGSIKSPDIEDFRNGNGPFRTTREFEEYWRNY